MRGIVITSVLFVAIFTVGIMIFANPFEVCVFSGVEARLMNHGEPVKNARVVRRWNWNEPGMDSTLTDEQGNFTLPAVFEASLSRLLPVELVIGQQLSVEIDGREVVFWTNSRREAGQNAEYAGAPFVIDCELTEKERLIEDHGSLMVTMCKLRENGLP